MAQQAPNAEHYSKQGDPHQYYVAYSLEENNFEQVVNYLLTNVQHLFHKHSMEITHMDKNLVCRKNSFAGQSDMNISIDCKPFTGHIFELPSDQQISTKHTKRTLTYPESMHIFDQLGIKLGKDGWLDNPQVRKDSDASVDSGPKTIYRKQFPKCYLHT